MFDPYAHLVYAGGRDDVRSVMIDGAWVMRDRVLTTLDEEAVLADARAIAEKIERHVATLQTV